MNLSRCDKGHFFDKEKFATCPHCQGGAGADDSLTTVFTEDMTAAGPVSPNPVPPISPAPAPAGDDSLPVGGTPVDQPTVPASGIGSGNTVPLTPPVTPGFDEFSPTLPVDDPDDDKTVGFFDFDPIFADESAKTQGSSQQGNGTSSPCVGWLIAIGGEHIGQDFRLKAGKNFIGRDISMDIALTGDKSVSRNRHAIVVYEPKQHLYLVQPGDSSGLVYRNNEVVLSPVKLVAYDMITVGEVNLLFMPLCGERFNWSTLLEEMSAKSE